MAISNGLRYLHLALLSRPVENRPLYRAIRRRRVRRIVEIGIGSVDRAVRMIQLASHFDSSTKVRYTGLDRFEMRDPETEPLSLKHAYRDLRGANAQVKLVPGIPAQTLVRVANTLTDTDLVLISAAESDMLADKAGYFLPRLLHDNSIVFEEHANGEGNTATWYPLTPVEIASRIKNALPSGRRAA